LWTNAVIGIAEDEEKSSKISYIMPRCAIDSGYLPLMDVHLPKQQKCDFW